MSRRLLLSSTLLVLLLALAQPANAGWWDDFVSGVQERVSEGASFLRDSLQSARAVNVKLNRVKAALEDPEMPDKIGDWFKEASSSVQEQVGELHKVVNDEVAPEWQKAVDAASNIMQTLSAVKLHDIAGTTSPDESD
ncbi:Protein K02B7.3 a [Aphelenchoides avenae]|nr:Protein K02B7.3 a [Aphelenchus avenae]